MRQGGFEIQMDTPTPAKQRGNSNFIWIYVEILGNCYEGMAIDCDDLSQGDWKSNAVTLLQ